MSSKGQVTLFIILGLVILLVFLISLQLINTLHKQQLTKVKEEVYSSIFTKEALRLFVDECLRQGMEQGLTLLGNQGRIWSDQPGGREPFVEGITGITLGTERLFYGISEKVYPTYQNAYPCSTDAGNPSFCEYSFPNTTTGFGSLKLDKRFIQADLERFLTKYTISCVEQLVRSEISNVAVIETSPEARFALAFNPGVITVKVNYPIKLRAGQGEFFHLSQFDFTYPSDIDQLLQAAILFPLRNDQKYVDFNYTESVLLQPAFYYRSEFQDPNYCGNENLCRSSTRAAQHTTLAIRMEGRNLANGDDVYSFTLPRSKIIFGSGGEYTYRFARQNRPPALDYINRSSCIAPNLGASYDYLVIQGDNDFGFIDIAPSALDPDEDRPIFSYEKPADFPEGGFPTNAERYFLSAQLALGIIPRAEPYLFKAKASDSYKEDFQEVRVLVDKPLITRMQINSPFTGREAHKNNMDQYILSREDPYFLDLVYQTSTGNLRSREVALKYVNGGLNLSFNYGFVADQANNCFGLPIERTSGQGELTVGSCSDLSYYDDLRFINQFDFQDQLQNPERRFFSDLGTFSLEATANYCGQVKAFSSNEVKVEIKGCIPYRNPEHPYSYPYHNQKADGTREEINPFLATHACCYGDINYLQVGPISSITEENAFSSHNFNRGEWRIAPAGTRCYSDPQPGCYGSLSGYNLPSSEIRGYVLETLFVTCDGFRGNTCQGGGQESDLLNSELRCGSRSIDSCDRVDANCENKLAWSFIDTNNDGSTDSWCHGRMGCETSVCNEIVYTNRAFRGRINLLLTAEEINRIAKERKATKDNDLPFQCGCDANTLGQPCDKEFTTGSFSRTCKAVRGGFACERE